MYLIKLCLYISIHLKLSILWILSRIMATFYEMDQIILPQPVYCDHFKIKSDLPGWFLFFKSTKENWVNYMANSKLCQQSMITVAKISNWQIIYLATQMVSQSEKFYLYEISGSLVVVNNLKILFWMMK